MTVIGKGYRLDPKTGKLIKKSPKPPSVSEKLRRKSSKRVRVKRRGEA